MLSVCIFYFWVGEAEPRNTWKHFFFAGVEWGGGLRFQSSLSHSLSLFLSLFLWMVFRWGKLFQGVIAEDIGWRQTAQTKKSRKIFFLPLKKKNGERKTTNNIRGERSLLRFARLKFRARVARIPDLDFNNFCLANFSILLAAPNGSCVGGSGANITECTHESRARRTRAAFWWFLAWFDWS